MVGLIALINAFVKPGPSKAPGRQRNRPSGPVMQYPGLGEVRFDGEGIWVGNTVFNGEQLEIAISGDVEGPDQVLVEKLLAHVNAMQNVQEKAIEFIKVQFAAVKDIDIHDFKIDSLDFLWPENPDYFMVQFRSEKVVLRWAGT